MSVRLILEVSNYTAGAKEHLAAQPPRTKQETKKAVTTPRGLSALGEKALRTPKDKTGRDKPASGAGEAIAVLKSGSSSEGGSQQEEHLLSELILLSRIP